ncbi:Outer membrane usher protein YraJ [Patescibacteria group bacterium]|nr:Outer membrane usher protein YraJ [Patescibacteria group bacterium]
MMKANFQIISQFLVSQCYFCTLLFCLMLVNILFCLPAQASPTNNAVATEKTATHSETLLLEVTVNDGKLPNIVQVEKLPDGRLVLPKDVWQAARLRPLDTALNLSDGNQGYALQAIPDLKYKLDMGKLTLDIIAPAEAFQVNTIDDGRGGTESPNPASLGFYLNYDVIGSRTTGNKLHYGAFLEAVVFNNMGSVVTNGLVRDTLNRTTFIRGDSYFQKDFPEDMESLVIGDTIGTSGAWSRAVRFGGVRWSRNFALRPGYFSFPLPSISGSAALPSTVDILVNDRIQKNLTVDSGVFTVNNMPVVTGAGEINLVVRNMLGVETLVTQRYYTSPRLLAEGLSDFSFEAGLFRQYYGQRNNSYGNAFAAGTWRQGLSNILTGELRLELQPRRQAAGLELSGTIADIAVARAATAYSRTNSVQGFHHVLGLERRSQYGSGSVQWEYFDKHYTPFASQANEIHPKHIFTAGYGMPIFEGTTIGVSYINQASWNGSHFELATANLGISLPWNMYLNAYAGKQLDENIGWNGGINLTIPLGEQHTVSASSYRDNSGEITNALQAMQSIPQGPGLGWRVRTSDNPNQKLQGGLTLNSDYGQFNIDANVGKRDTNIVRVGANGSIGFLEGLPFATRKIGLNSFAVVKVGDIENVPVYRSNQMTATTNSDGMALIANVLPYQKNEISINPNELPFNVDIKSTKETVNTYARSGVLVDFPIRSSRNALLILQQSNGTPVPAGATVTLNSNDLKFIVVKRGEVYLTDLNTGDNQITVEWQGGHCKQVVNIDQDSETEPRMTLNCGDAK